MTRFLHARISMSKLLIMSKKGVVLTAPLLCPRLVLCLISSLFVCHGFDVQIVL
jgi:hypothetical protein